MEGTGPGRRKAPLPSPPRAWLCGRIPTQTTGGHGLQESMGPNPEDLFSALRLGGRISTQLTWGFRKVRPSGRGLNESERGQLPRAGSCRLGPQAGVSSPVPTRWARAGLPLLIIQLGDRLSLQIFPPEPSSRIQDTLSQSNACK